MNFAFLKRSASHFRAHQRREAIVYILISTAAFSCMNILIRLAGQSLDAALLVTLRNLLTLALLLPFVAPNRFAIIRTERLKTHVWRSAIGATGMVVWTYCLTIMPTVHATALSFTAPLLVTLFAILVLKEHSRPRHFIGLAIGFLGALIILRPSIHGFEWNSLLVLFATSAWATTSIFVKSLSRTEPPLRMVFYMNLFMFILTLPLGFTHWQMPTAHVWMLLFGISLCSIVMHFTMVSAYARAPVVTLMPFDFMRLVYTSLLAYVIFGETSDLATWIGAAVIIASAVFIAGRDTKVIPIEE